MKVVKAIRVDPDLWRMAKAEAAKLGLTLEEWFELALQTQIAGGKK
jgi:hypothetical protein